MTLKSFWRQDGISPIIGEDALVQYLLKKENGIVFLSTVPSSDGEMRIVNALTARKDAKLFYCRELVEGLIKIILNNPHGIATDELCARINQYPVIAIRFANWIYGLTSTMESLALICKKVSKECLVVISGDHLQQYIPELLQALPQAEKFYICY